METDLAKLNAGVQERSLPLEPTVEDGRTLSGYFARWNEPANIGGEFIERFAPNSMDESIAGGKIKILFDHGQDPSVGRKVIASLRSIVDDGEGALYEAELLDAPYVNDLLPGLRAGLYGASFRFRALEQKVNRRPGKSPDNPDGLPEVLVTRAHAVEAGPTALPAYAGATAHVRSIDVTPDPEVTEVTPTPKVHQRTFQTRKWYLR